MIGVGALDLTLVSESGGAPDRKNIPAQVPTRSPISGAILVPAKTTEQITNVAYAVNTYTMYAPPFPNVLAIKPDDLIIDNQGNEYHVAGAQPWHNPNGTVNHVKVLLWQPSGLNEPPSTAY